MIPWYWPNLYLNAQTPKKRQKQVMMYITIAVHSGQIAFYYLIFSMLLKKGDGERIMRQYKYMMLYCKVDGSHSTNYSLECLYHFFLMFTLLSQRDSEHFVWNRFVNNSGKKAANIPIDEGTKHDNNAINQGIRNIGPNVTENAV